MRLILMPILGVSAPITLMPQAPLRNLLGSLTYFT